MKTSGSPRPATAGLIRTARSRSLRFVPMPSPALSKPASDRHNAASSILPFARYFASARRWMPCCSTSTLGTNGRALKPAAESLARKLCGQSIYADTAARWIVRDSMVFGVGRTHPNWQGFRSSSVEATAKGRHRACKGATLRARRRAVRWTAIDAHQRPPSLEQLPQHLTSSGVRKYRSRYGDSLAVVDDYRSRRGIL